MYLVKDINKKELLISYKREHIINWLELLGISCRLVIEIPEECIDSIYSYQYKNKSLKNVYHILEDFFEHLKLLIPSCYLKDWSFELKMDWAWMIPRNNRDYKKYKTAYKRIYKLISQNFQESEVGLYLGDIDVVKSDYYLNNMEDIAIGSFRPNFFSLWYIGWKII